MHALADAGRFVILVSHRLAELVAHAARVAVVREGRCAAILSGDELNEESIAQQLVVGRRSGRKPRAPSSGRGRTRARRSGSEAGRTLAARSGTST